MAEELRQEFLNETIRNLESLQEELKTGSAEILSDKFLRRFFRQLHTVKGTAQTFGFNNLARIAHEIENLLQAINTNTVQQTKQTSSVIEESIIQLLYSCRDDNQPISSGFLNKINLLIPAAIKKTSDANLDGKIPKNLLSQLSTQEIDSLNAAIKLGKIFYLIEIFFDFSTLNKGFIEFRQVLSEKGEIIAVAPNANADAARDIGFQIFYVTDRQSFEVSQLIKPFKAKVDFESRSSKKHSNNLTGLLSNLIADCEKKARILEKKVLFEISNETADIARKNLILINYSVLHLLRNAVDHAIESPGERIAANKPPTGKIKISVFQKSNQLVLRIEDDGRGINAEKITAQAQKRGIIAADKILDKDETLNLIFTHGFSTSESVSEISGRGIGLDMVNDLIKKAGGSIKIQTEINRGTSFEIYLPQ